MIKTFPILYGVSSKGTTKVWGIWVERKTFFSVIFTKHGQLDGKMQIAEETIREGKNIGKSNETTHFDQACLEAESKWKKKHDSNYTDVAPTLLTSDDEDSEDSQGSTSHGSKLLPMLAQKFAERKKYISWPAFIQPKLNGVRCLVQRVGDKIFYWSRKAKLYKNFNLYMDSEFLSFMKDGDILDGEMYNHGDITFQELVSLIKDEKRPDITHLKQYVKFYCYDRPDTSLGFKDRFFGRAMSDIQGEYIRIVTTHKIFGEAEMIRLHGEFVGLGYEGTIVRSGGDEPYRFQYRDNQLQKYKDFVDAEFTIVGCKQGSGKDEGKAIFRCATKNKTGGSYGDGTFDVRCKATMKERAEQWEKKASYMGKPLTVRYQTLSDEGIPIFPVGIVVRDYE